jgi:hypothetical protein
MSSWLRDSTRSRAPFRRQESRPSLWAAVWRTDVDDHILPLSRAAGVLAPRRPAVLPARAATRRELQALRGLLRELLGAQQIRCAG